MKSNPDTMLFSGLTVSRAIYYEHGISIEDYCKLLLDPKAERDEDGSECPRYATHIEVAWAAR